MSVQEMVVSDNPGLRKDRSDPTLICTAYKKNRFYLFTKNNPGEAKRCVIKKYIYILLLLLLLLLLV